MAKRPRATVQHAERIRRRLTAQPELELDAEELQALADHGIDPEEVRRIALEHADGDEVSDQDRDTARDTVEALISEVAEEDGP
jgi:hypothetical protein